MTIEQIRMLSFGGGVDSTALLAIHLDRDRAAAFLEMTREQLDEAFPPMEAVVFSDPGSEWPETYLNIDYARERCEKAGVRFEVVRHHNTIYVHKEFDEMIEPARILNLIGKQGVSTPPKTYDKPVIIEGYDKPQRIRMIEKDWKALPKEEQANYTKRWLPYTIYEWLLDGGMLPLIPGGGGHTCSMRFKGSVQQDWADEEFPNATKMWSLGIELEVDERSERFTANHGKNLISGHEYDYPLQELKMGRQECLDMLDHLGWDYRGDGSPVQKSSCMWCPYCKEWEIDRLIEADGQGLQEGLAIEERFVEVDKHAEWHENGMRLNRGGRCNAGEHRTPMATGWCDHPDCTHVYKLQGITKEEKREYPKPYTPGSWKLTPSQFEKGIFSTYYAGEVKAHLTEEEKARYKKEPVKNHGKAQLFSLKYKTDEGTRRKSIVQHIQRHSMDNLDIEDLMDGD